MVQIRSQHTSENIINYAIPTQKDNVQNVSSSWHIVLKYLPSYLYLFKHQQASVQNMVLHAPKNTHMYNTANSSLSQSD